MKTGYPANDPLYRYFPQQQEIELLCMEYELGELVTNHGDLGGLYNVNLKIETTKGTFVIRISSGLANARQMEYAQRVISTLQTANISVLAPLRNIKGKYYSTYKDRFVQITSYIDAHPFESTVKHTYSSGKMLRSIHDALVSMEDGPVPEWSNYPSKEVLNEGLTLLNQIDDIPDDQLARVERMYERMSREWDPHQKHLPKTVIHGDWHVWNSLYDSVGNIVAVLDFDFLQRAERLHDIAYMLWVLLPNGQSSHLGKSFLEGYGPLTQMEQDLLPVAIARASAFFLCTASFVPDPVAELPRQLEKQEPFIEWLLSEKGRNAVAKLSQPDG